MNFVNFLESIILLVKKVSGENNFYLTSACTCKQKNVGRHFTYDRRMNVAKFVIHISYNKYTHM